MSNQKTVISGSAPTGNREQNTHLSSVIRHQSSVLDQYGNPFDLKTIAEPQTARVAALQNTYIESQLAGLTPARAAAILAAADLGDITAQHRLFEDMHDRDAHLQCEFSKRAGAVVTLDWSVEPPPNASRAEEQAAAWAEDMLRTVVDDFDAVLLAMMDGVGHGFAAIELEWKRWGGEYIPAFHPRPQDWFRLDMTRRALHLNDNSPDGQALTSMGWILHTPGKAKTGYLARLPLYRVLVWPFLYKSYGIGDLAEFLETYGLPIIIGKYYNGAQPEEKASLMRAVTALGHDARAIMPQEMAIEIQKITSSGDSATHLAMVDWAERAQSKAILGQVLSAEAKATGLGSGVADLQGEVRRDILKADARQIGNTLTRDLIYPLATLTTTYEDGFFHLPGRDQRIVTVSVKEHQSKHGIGRGEAKPNHDKRCSIRACYVLFAARENQRRA
ncbi:MAG: DUF935 domain-containing protein [Azonexus sp.]|jgi:phage gp29-like protein|uniref:phage portal protein family protein n=1 Tax=Azonexus sp. TaxID=1872668 RepID=UPI00282B6A93|nr:DUF935 family protein [Azonexus sp.]MDR0775907.1 DUF935 domain-containing protein [Azonexus sp.]